MTLARTHSLPRAPKLRIGLLIVLLFSLVNQLPRPLAGSDRPAVASLDSIGITVSDIDRSVDFFSKVLSFEKVSDTELFGSEYEHLQGLFGMRARVVRMKLGEESIVLTEYLTPKGRPIPIDSRSNDRWFQHIAIIVSNMDRAYQWLRQNKVEHGRRCLQPELWCRGTACWVDTGYDISANADSSAA